MQKAKCGMQIRMRGRRILCIGVAFCLVPSAFAFAQAPADAPTVVVPFDNPAQEPRLAWMREGAAILLSDALAAAGSPIIEREERLQAFDRLQLPANATLSRASTIRVGHTLAAAAVVTGTLQTQSDQLIVRARVVRIDTGRILPEVESAGPLPEMFKVFATL